MPLTPLAGPRRRARVVLSSTALLSFMSVRKAAALALAQLGIAAFFVPGIISAEVGPAAGWFVLAAVLLAACVRAVDIESWAVFIPGGVVGRVSQAYGPAWSGFAAAVVASERFLLAALAVVVIGHYASTVAVTAIGGWRLTGLLRPEDFATVLAVGVIGLLWIRARIGRDLRPDTIARGVWIGVAILLLTTVAGVVSAVRSDAPLGLLTSAPVPVTTLRWYLDIAVTCLVGLALALPTIGGGEALAQAAHELQPPRVQALRRAALVTLIFALCVTTLCTFLFVLLVPAVEQSAWVSAPLAGLAQHLVAPPWVRGGMAIALVFAAALMLAPAAHAALGDAEHLLERLAAQGTLPDSLTALHARFGTPARAMDVAAAATVLVILAGGGRVQWLGRAYAVAVAVAVVLKVATLLELRRSRAEPAAHQPPAAPRRPDHPLGLAACAVIVAAGAAALILRADGPSLAGLALLGGLAILFSAGGREADARSISEDPATLDLLPAAELSLDHIDARPGNVLVTVRNPRSLVHLTAALEGAGDRDVVVMTVRLVGVDVPDDAATDAAPTRAEQRLLSAVVALAERRSRPVRLLIVPARNVFDAIARRSLRLRSSEIHVGESATLSADDQARLLGEAWERVAEARTARRPPRRPSPQRPHRHLSARRASAVAQSRRSRSDSPALARRRRSHRPARASPRRRPGRA